MSNPWGEKIEEELEGTEHIRNLEKIMEYAASETYEDRDNLSKEDVEISVVEDIKKESKSLRIKPGLTTEPMREKIFGSIEKYLEKSTGFNDVNLRKTGGDIGKKYLDYDITAK